jgi:hypothetical protein
MVIKKDESLKNGQYITNLYELITKTANEIFETRESVMQMIETYTKPIEMHNIETTVIDGDAESQVIDSQVMEQLDIGSEEIEKVEGQKKFSEMPEIKEYYNQKLLVKLEIPPISDEEDTLIAFANKFKSAEQYKDLETKIAFFNDILENAPDGFFTARKSSKDKHNYAYHLKEEIIKMTEKKAFKTNKIRPYFSKVQKQFKKASLTDLYVVPLVKAINHEKMKKHKTRLIRVFDGILFNDAIQKVNRLYLASATLQAENNMCARETRKEKKKGTKLENKAPTKREKANGIVERMQAIIKSWENTAGSGTSGDSLVNVLLRNTIIGHINKRLPVGCQKVSL